MSLQVRLYSRPGCHLCDDALAELQRLQRLARDHPLTLQVVDITAEAELMQRYGERIPVLEVGGREYDAPLRREVLERALAEAAAT